MGSVQFACHIKRALACSKQVLLLVQHVQEMLTVILAFLVVGPMCFLADLYKLSLLLDSG